MTGFLAIVAGALLEMLQMAPVPSGGAPEPQDPDRPRLSIRDFRGLRENNIFAPAKPVRTSSPRTEGGRKETPSAPPPSLPSKPRTPVVTGFVFDHQSQAFQVLVEDRNSDVKLKLFAQPRFLRAGEEFLGYVIEAVDRETVSVRAGETVKALKAGESFPEGAVPAPVKTEAPAAPSPEKTEGPAEPAKAEPSKGEPAKAEAPAEDPGRHKVLEELRKKFKKKRDEADFEQP